MDAGKLRNKKWYPNTVAICAGVVLYVVLTHLSSIGEALHKFGGYFSPLVLGAILAYLMNPLATQYEKLLFKKLKNKKVGWALSISLALITVLLVLGFVLGTLIPQLVNSAMTLVDNMDEYLASLKEFTERIGVAEFLKLDQLLDSSESIIKRVTRYISENYQTILSASASAGKGVVNWLIALILSIYLLASKGSIKRGSTRLLRALIDKKWLDSASKFVERSDKIVIRYIAFTLLDAFIVGTANAIFMAILGMQYIGLVSMVVAVTNIIPTFGPVIGAVIGGFVLLLVNPFHALAFIIFTMVLQFLDGYVIKPKLFGDTLGVSGLLILAAVVVCGNMFGIVGILLSIPLAAILDFVYKESVIKALEERRRKKDAEKESELKEKRKTE